jgi:hypothetical protein
MLKELPVAHEGWYCMAMSRRPLAASSTEVSPEPTDPDAEVRPEPDAAESFTALVASKLSRWAALAALAIAVIALTLTIVQWIHPPSRGSASPTFTNQQVKAAKTNVCAAYTTVHRAVVTNTNLESPPDGGPISPLAVATSARLALYGGGGYLQERLAREPATPLDLTKAVTSMATTLEDLGINYLADAPDFTQDRLRQNLNRQMSDVERLCK